MYTSLPHRSSLITLILMILCTPVFCQYTPSYYTVELPASTLVMLELAESLDSHEVEVGQSVRMTVSMNVKIQGTIVIKHNAAATGKVTRVTKPTYNHPATIEIKATMVQNVDDERIPLNGTPLLCKGLMPLESFTMSPGKTLEAYTLQNETIRISTPRR
jgi:hypothetical protein